MDSFECNVDAIRQNAGVQSGTGHVTDPAAQDYNNVSGPQTGTGGPGHLDGAHGRNWDTNAGYDATGAAAGTQSESNPAGMNTGTTASINTNPSVGTDGGTHVSYFSPLHLAKVRALTIHQSLQHGIGHGHHAGFAVGSAALREQAMLRDREAQNYQAQSAELAEAERLEQKAREHRERAVAQGTCYPSSVSCKFWIDQGLQVHIQ